MEEKNFTETQRIQFREWRRKGKNRVMQFIEIKRKKEISIRILFLFKVAARKSREKRIIGIEQLKVAREKKIKQLKGLDQDFSKLEKERMNLMRAVQSFAQHFALTT
jgi:hypothetical protein